MIREMDYFAVSAISPQIYLGMLLTAKSLVIYFPSRTNGAHVAGRQVVACGTSSAANVEAVTVHQSGEACG
jgi:hypothetical protein